MSKVRQFQKKDDDICSFCGAKPDHEGFWQCSRLKSVSMDPDGAWAVEFWPEPKEQTSITIEMADQDS